MSEPYLAEIRQFGFGFSPRGWAQCNGQILPINQNQALFALLGTTYGGDGRTSFGLPDLRGRAAMHRGDAGTAGSSTRRLGEKFGEETEVLNMDQIPAHSHTLFGTESFGTTRLPGAQLLASPWRGDGFAAGPADRPLNAQTVGDSGGGEAHNNMQPFLALNFAIALTGLFPPRN